MVLFKTIDLCAGIGGIRRGFELTHNFINVLSAEIDTYACKTYEHLYGENPYNDLTSVEFKKKLINIPYDILLAGFPCQTFSRAGLQKGFKDSVKGIIFEHIQEIIAKTRPRAIFLENVDHLIRHDKGKTFHTIIKKLEEDLNYKVIGVDYNLFKKFEYDGKNFVRNSKNFGVPQNRPRTYIMAFDRNRYKEKISLLNNHYNRLPNGNNLCLYNDLNDLLDFKANAKYYLSSGYLETLEKHKLRNEKKGNGFGLKIVNSKEIKNPIANTIMAVGGSGRERNLVYDPQKGIENIIVPQKHSKLNSKGIRIMTPNEWGKLQGFIKYAFVDKNGIDKFSFPKGLSDTQKYKQFGNAVTIPVIETMANFMIDCFKVLGDYPTDKNK